MHLSIDFKTDPKELLLKEVLIVIYMKSGHCTCSIICYMLLLNKASKFTSQISDLTTIYKVFIRSILENSCVVWHSSLTEQANRQN